MNKEEMKVINFRKMLEESQSIINRIEKEVQKQKEEIERKIKEMGGEDVENHMTISINKSYVNVIKNNKLIRLTSEMLSEDSSINVYQILMNLQENLNIHNNDVKITNDKCSILYECMKIEYHKKERNVKIIKNGKIVVFITLPNHLIPFDEVFNNFINDLNQLI